MSILFAVLLFSLLIFVHELGHFLAAKKFGVQVNEFSMFMGPAILKKQVGETVYSLRCIPVGGFCAMEGEDGDSENPRAFGRAAWWKRLIILLAGAAMNFIAGLLILLIVFAPSKEFVMPEISAAEPGSAVISEEGLHLGDRILKVDGERVYVQSDFSMLLSMNPGDIHDIVVLRNGKRVELNDFHMEKREFTDPDGTTFLRYGFQFAVKDADFLTTLGYVWNTALNMVRNVRLSLQMIFTGQAGLKDMSGPVGIVQMMSTTAEASETSLDAFMNMMYFGGFIAINLAVMNLLPVPALDGGRAVCLLLTTAVEKVTRKKINPKYEGYLHGVGMILLLGLMAILMFKDFFVIFKG